MKANHRRREVQIFGQISFYSGGMLCNKAKRNLRNAAPPLLFPLSLLLCSNLPWCLTILSIYWDLHLRAVPSSKTTCSQRIFLRAVWNLKKSQIKP